MSRDKKDHSAFFLYLLLSIAGVIIYLGMYKMQPSQSTEFSSHLESGQSHSGDHSKLGSGESQEEELKRINQHLFLQAQKQELERMKQNIQNHQSAPDIQRKQDSERELLTGKGVHFETDLRQKKIQRDTGRPDKPIEIKELHQVVAAELARQNLKIKKSEIVQDNYAEAYVQYARKQGYDVKLQRSGDHYIVESVTPLRQPGSEIDQEDLIDSNDIPEEQGAQ